MLANDANPVAVKMKPIKMFIELMWDEFQPAIRWCVFYPYCFYLFVVYNLTGSMLEKFLQSCENKNKYLHDHGLPHQSMSVF